MLREAFDKYNAHLIADEIAVGLGRTETLFACEQAAISPDFLCLSKGLTGGYLLFLQCLPPIKSTMHFMIIILAKKRSYIHIAIQVMC
ncbi:MAG: aminotransferase class III-fold pyridoxal phosphate-dependent enzyme [Methylococcaceae bacterium]